MADDRNHLPEASRLLSYHLKPAQDGLVHHAVMLCEMIGDEIQSVSLRVAADPMMRPSRTGPELRSEQF